MKTLSLYIDKWYIVAVENSDNVLQHIELPNREDRIWLYFYEDINNNQILYGKNYQRNFFDKECHYYGDIFKEILQNNKTFSRFGYKVDIKEIFKDSEIFEHLRSNFEEEKVPTYISFSGDVSYAAQKVFLDILTEENFDIKESVARLSHLALELSSRRHLLDGSNAVLVLSACNENLRFAVYKKGEKVFLRKGEEGLLVGKGTDLRGRALLEQIIWQINKTSNLLRNEEDFESEVVRLSQNMEAWLVKLDKSNNHCPVIYNDITFSRAPYNKKNATVLKKDVEERTKAIVDTVIDNVADYIKSLGLGVSELSHIMFIGDSFKNRMFTDALLKKFPVKDDNIILYESRELAEIVSVYNSIDLSQFKGIHEHIEKASEEELEQIRIANQEREEREKAARQQENIDQAYTEAHLAEKKFDLTMKKVDTYEKKGDYSSMIDVLKIALTIKPEDSEALQLLESANRKLSEEKVKSDQYNKTIRLAQEAFKEHRWNDACTKSEMAKDLKPNSQEANRIYKESKRKIQLEQSVKDFLLRADTFIGQKLYQQALEELNKAKLADENNEEIKDRINRIENIHQQQINEVLEIKNRLSECEKDNNYKTAIELCEILSEKEKIKQVEWRERKTQLQKLSDFLEQINDLNFNEEWEKLVHICKKYSALRDSLHLSEDRNLTKLLAKAETKTETLLAKYNFEKEVAVIKSLIADQKWEEAKNLTKKLQRIYPDNHIIIKDLWQKIFSAEDVWSNNSKNTDRTIIKGFKVQPNKQNKVPDFFEMEPSQKAKTTSKDDFFDSVNSSIKGINNKRITNDDFNF